MSDTTDRASLRDSMRAKRAQLADSARQEAERGIAQQIGLYLDHLADRLLPETLVCSFRSSPRLGEISTQAVDTVLRSRGFRVAYPRVTVGSEQLLDFRIAPAWDSGQGWEQGALDIAQPADACPVAELRDIALILVPGLAFDVASGARIGYGKGHYDRWLAHFDAIRQSPVPRLGLGFEFQVVSGLQPQAWDKAMDGVLTPTRLELRHS